MVKAGEKYRHFKGGEYEVVGVARNCDDASQEVVVYRELSGSGKIWVRELGEFEGFKDGVKRFEFIGGSGVVVKVKRLKGHAVLPRYAHEGDAGMDVFSAEDYVVPAGKRQLVSTGIAMELPKGYFSSIRGKSGLAYKKGICTLGGVIEYTYRGEYGVIVLNTGDEDFVIRRGDKVAQIVVCPVASVGVEEVDGLSESVRGDGGFGSTGGSNVGNEEIELERTFLAKYLPEDLGDFEELEDNFFPRDSKHPVLRLRRRGDRLLMTKKTLKGEGSFTEFVEETIKLSPEEHSFFSCLDGKRHSKRRYSYDFADKVKCEIDVYQGDLKGLVLVDFEFADVEAKKNFVVPDFCLREVSGMEFLAGGVLCGKKYEDIEERLSELGYEKL